MSSIWYSAWHTWTAQFMFNITILFSERKYQESSESSAQTSVGDSTGVRSWWPLCHEVAPASSPFGCFSCLQAFALALSSVGNAIPWGLCGAAHLLRACQGHLSHSNALITPTSPYPIFLIAPAVWCLCLCMCVSSVLPHWRWALYIGTALAPECASEPGTSEVQRFVGKRTREGKVEGRKGRQALVVPRDVTVSSYSNPLSTSYFTM